MKQRSIAVLVGIILLINTCTNTSAIKPISDSEYIDSKMAYYENKYRFQIKYKPRIKQCIIQYSQKYNIDTRIFCDLIGVESHFKYNAYSYAGARGLCQIMPCWSHLFFYIDDGKLGTHLLNKGITDYRRFYYRIGYNTQIGAFILNHLLRKYGSYEVALVFYNQGSKSDFKKCRDDINYARKKRYVKAVLGI